MFGPSNPDLRLMHDVILSPISLVPPFPVRLNSELRTQNFFQGESSSEDEEESLGGLPEMSF